MQSKCVTLALQPGLAVWEAFHDPKDGKVKLDGDNVVTFPKLPEFQQVTLKVLRWEERDKRLVIKEAELCGRVRPGCQAAVTLLCYADYALDAFHNHFRTAGWLRYRYHDRPD